MVDDPTENGPERDRAYHDDGKTPMTDFNEATSFVVDDVITIKLTDTRRAIEDPRKGVTRYLRTQVEGAKALRAALDEAIAKLEGKRPKD